MQSQERSQNVQEVSSPQTPLFLSSKTPRGDLGRVDELTIPSPSTDGFKPVRPPPPSNTRWAASNTPPHMHSSNGRSQSKAGSAFQWQWFDIYYEVPTVLGLSQCTWTAEPLGSTEALRRELRDHPNISLEMFHNHDRKVMHVTTGSKVVSCLQGAITFYLLT